MRYLTTLFLALLFVACNDTEVADSTPLKPTIYVDSQDDSYTTKVGTELTITPTYENIEGATFSWVCSGVELSTAQSLTFSSDEVGDFYIMLSVSNSVATAYKEIKISVLKLSPPALSLDDSYCVEVGVEFSIYPSVSGGEEYAWSVDSEQVSQEATLIYTMSQIGSYTLELKASNEDGFAAAETTLNVVAQEDMPFSWSFESETYNVSLGRKIRLKCWNIEYDMGGDYVWSISGEEIQRGSSTEYIFNTEAVGEQIVTVTKYNTKGEISATQDLTINTCEAEGYYKRATTGESSCNRVYEFMPAAGQYINDGYSCATMAEATAYAESQLSAQSVISLGAFGGYIVVGFDHSVPNSGAYDIQIVGNAFETSSEPGIVWVMQDENGDGLPNDTWYELSGSESLTNTLTRDYSITYYAPSISKEDIRWSDNMGGYGVVSYSTFHTQESYFPAWVEGESLTFYGTRLDSKTYELSASNWVNPAFGWGYADNYSEVDMLGSTYTNHLRISDAVDYAGESIHLEYIDFVKIQTGVNDTAGWFGEVSTEICGVKSND